MTLHSYIHTYIPTSAVFLVLFSSFDFIVLREPAKKKNHCRDSRCTDASTNWIGTKGMTFWWTCVLLMSLVFPFGTGFWKVNVFCFLSFFLHRFAGNREGILHVKAR